MVAGVASTYCAHVAEYVLEQLLESFLEGRLPL